MKEYKSNLNEIEKEYKSKNNNLTYQIIMCKYIL